MSEVTAALMHRRGGLAAAVPALLVASLLVYSMTYAQTTSRTVVTQEDMMAK